MQGLVLTGAQWLLLPVWLPALSQLHVGWFKIKFGNSRKWHGACQCGKPIRHGTLSTDQRAQVINSQFRYFHSHSCPHRHPRTVWLHVYKAIYRNRNVGWAIQVQTAFQQTEEETEEILLLPGGKLPMARTDIKKIETQGCFCNIWAHISVSVHQIKEKSRQSTTQGLPGGQDSACKGQLFNTDCPKWWWATKMSNSLLLN